MRIFTEPVSITSILVLANHSVQKAKVIYKKRAYFSLASNILIKRCQTGIKPCFATAKNTPLLAFVILVTTNGFRLLFKLEAPIIDI
jgi:hypothetical protein